jgi:GMP synthase (glutamine-hydrolysing)
LDRVFARGAIQLRFLLLQTRNPHDPMRSQEVRCFARALSCKPDDIRVVDLLSRWPSDGELAAADIILMGGSGEYSATSESAWLLRTLAGLRELCERRIPTFASCWGFQAIARALGGRCVNDPPHAELGNVELMLTEDGKSDPVFGPLPARFSVLAGHEDHVVELPPQAVRLASTERAANQAFRVAEFPVYCTQFHPELDRAAFVERVQVYPQYVQRIAGIPLKEFMPSIQETPESNTLLKRFVEFAYP